MREIKVLFDEETIERRVKEVARQIEEDYKNSEEIVAVCVLKGAVYYFTELTKNIKKNVILDFMKASSYVGTESTGVIAIKNDISTDIKGKDVLIVEDIIDTGLTLEKLKKYLYEKGAASVKITVLLDKKARRKADVTSDYACFDIDDKFVVGYGLDYDEVYRNLPFVGYIEQN